MSQSTPKSVRTPKRRTRSSILPWTAWRSALLWASVVLGFQFSFILLVTVNSSEFQLRGFGRQPVADSWAFFGEGRVACCEWR